MRRARTSWQCLNLVVEVAKDVSVLRNWFGFPCFARLALPLAARHTELVEGICSKISVVQTGSSVRSLNRGLTAREIEVCARAAYGMSVEGTSIDLGLGRASVLTYRKRAYSRLRVSSVYELSRL